MEAAARWPAVGWLARPKSSVRIVKWDCKKVRYLGFGGVGASTSVGLILGLGMEMPLGGAKT
jgi:hypothetical protein